MLQVTTLACDAHGDGFSLIYFPDHGDAFSPIYFPDPGHFDVIAIFCLMRLAGHCFVQSGPGLTSWLVCLPMIVS